MRAVLLMLLLVPTACASRPEVRQYGSMREVLREGDSRPRVALREVVGPRTIAIGALAGLEGEITVLDGRAWVARPAGSALTVSGPAPDPEDYAALLTAAEVPAWTEETFGTTSASGRDPDQAIEFGARGSGLDTTKPFPFTVTGDFTTLDIHVINGACIIANPDLPPEHQPWRWSAGGVPVRATIVGFYAPDAAGVMTHHGTAIHAHAIIERDGEVITGHVERFAMPARGTIGFPAR